MGVAASIARRQASRSIKNYNVEERAMKVISQDKPTPAPPHPSMKQVMDKIKRDPSKMKTTRTDPGLLKNLSQVYIKSTGDNPEIVAKRPNPINRTPPEETLLGYEDPKNLPAGKASLRNVLEILQKKSEGQENFTPEQIVAEYKLDMVDAMNLTQYYKAMLVLKPPPIPKKKASNPLRRLQDGIDNLKK